MTKRDYSKQPVEFKQLRKDDMMWNYISLRNWLSKGNNDMAMVRYLLLLVGIGNAAATSTIEFTITLGIVYAVVALVYGFGWDYKRYNVKESEWANQRRDWFSFRKGLGVGK